MGGGTPRQCYEVSKPRSGIDAFESKECPLENDELQDHVLLPAVTPFEHEMSGCASRKKKKIPQCFLTHEYSNCGLGENETSRELPFMFMVSHQYHAMAVT